MTRIFAAADRLIHQNQITIRSTRYLSVVVLGVMLGILYVAFYLFPPSEVLITSANRLSNDVILSAVDMRDKEEEQCVPHHHVFFLKSHKCGSTTVQNVLLRYGINNNLTFALPPIGHILGYPRLFKANMIPRNLLPLSGKVDIFAMHARLNVPELVKILHSDTRWITIVREPVSLYESLFSYYKMEKRIGFQLSQYKSKPVSKLMSLPLLMERFRKNQMLFEMGYSRDETVTEMWRAIVEMDNVFDLVLISELMEESLILLRYLLCWSLQDVIVFTLNARRGDTKPTLDPETVAFLREYNSADVILYDHFLTRHHKAVLEFGVSRMAKEVAALRSLINEYYENCGVQRFKGRDPSLKTKMFSSLVSAYVPANTSDQNCMILTLPEPELVEIVRQHHKAVIQSNK